MKTELTELQELDELASKFIIGHKELTETQKFILNGIEDLRKDSFILENRLKRIKVLINAMSKELGAKDD
jgi:hypothetical protein